jgi:hypothetical protein
MADLCGPSNALQSFQKHSQQDRTLQQDRLVSKSSHSQEFRSASHAQGALDPEFEAFQAGVAPPSIATPPPFFAQQPLLHSQPVAQHIPQQAQNAAPDWALDFQRLNLSGPASVMDKGKMAVVQQQQPQMQHNAYSGMGMDAMQQPYSYMNSMSQGYGPASMGMSMGFMGLASQQQQTMFNPATSQQVSEPTFDAAAFARAFDEATAEIESQQHQHIEVQSDVEAVMTGAATEQANSSILTTHFQNAAFEHPSAMQEPTLQKEGVDKIEESDALAHTAGQLLDSVSHDTSEKFAQSSFLALMKRLRDGEVKVEGENFIEVSIVLHHINGTN